MLVNCVYNTLLQSYKNGKCMQNHDTVLYMDLKGKMNTSNVPDLPNKLFSFVCVTTI